jgi:signal transduction histidine kinase
MLHNYLLWSFPPSRSQLRGSGEARTQQDDDVTTAAAPAAAKAARRFFQPAALPWLILAVGIPASFLLFTLIKGSVENVARLRFEREANDANAIIDGRLRSYSDVLYALRALFSSEEPVGRVRFHRFVTSLDLKQRYPGFLSLNYAAHVRAPDRKRFEEAVRIDSSLDHRGYPQFAIKPPGERPEYFVLVYLEPMQGYEFAFGLDLGANPMAREPEKVAEAVNLHRDSGNLSASAQPLRVKQRSEAIYLAMRLAVYRQGMPSNTVEQRRAAYIGSVGAAFDVEYLMREALNDEMLRYMRLRLYDAGASGGQRDPAPPGEPRLLFDSFRLSGRGSGGAEIGPPGAEFVHVLPVEIAGRVWNFQYSAPKNAIISDIDRLLPPAVLTGGILFSLLVFGVLYFLASSRSRAVDIANEITKDLRASEEELRASAEQLQALSRRLVEVQESERRELARELHDRVGQDLTALSISLDILRTQLPDKSGEAMRSRIDDAAALLDATAGTIENVMSELRPPMLDDYGLLPALQWYAAEFSGRTGIEVKVHGDEGMERLPQASEIALFRITQEALTNVAKHAHATRVEIGLEHTDTGFTLSIRDDGVGLESGAAPVAGRRQGLGMVTMRERTQSAGGRFEIASVTGGGTRVVVRIPRT